MTKEKLLKKAEEILEQEGSINKKEELSNVEFIEKFILPGLRNSKNTLSDIQGFEIRKTGGIVGKIRFFILSKIKNIVINTIEKQSAKQQKFNELVYQAIEKLVKEKK